MPPRTMGVAALLRSLAASGYVYFFSGGKYWIS